MGRQPTPRSGLALAPPRWVPILLSAVALTFGLGTGAALLAALRGPIGLWVLVVVLGAGTVTATAIALVCTRTVALTGGALVVTGWRPRQWPVDTLTGPLDQRLFGVSIGSEDDRRLVLAQLPHLTSTLAAELPLWAPQLRPPERFPVVIPGRIGTPVAYGLSAGLTAFFGIVALRLALVDDPDGPNRVVAGVFGLVMTVGGSAVVWWAVRRAERRVEIHADRVVRVHLFGRRTEPVPGLAAAVVATASRRLPKSTLERPVHRIRLVDRAGGAAEVAPMLAAFPDYGSGEGALAAGRARRVERLAGIARGDVDLFETPHGEIALWHHGESSPGALRTTVVFPRPVGGRWAVALLDGRVAVGGTVADAVVVGDDRDLHLIDLDRGTVCHVDLGVRITGLRPGFGLLDTVDGARPLSELVELCRPGWPSRRPDRMGVPMTGWLDPLDRLLTTLERESCPQGLRDLVAVRAFGAAVALLQPPGDEPAHPLLAQVLEVARLDDPVVVTGCPGGGRPVALGPDGRPECRTCGVTASETTMPEHDWPNLSRRCDGSLRAAADRLEATLAGTCPHCGAPGPLTLDGLIRLHPDQRSSP